VQTSLRMSARKWTKERSSLTCTEACRPAIGVAIDVYTTAALSRRAEAAEQLEKPVLTA